MNEIGEIAGDVLKCVFLELELWYFEPIFTELCYFSKDQFNYDFANDHEMACRHSAKKHYLNYNVCQAA